MKPDHSFEHKRDASVYQHPTSPWTELYQRAVSQPANTPSQQDCADFENAAYSRDDQRPTHDALSDIYNRGYE